MRWGDPSFSDVLFGLGLVMLTVLWGLLIAAVGQWGRGWRLRPQEGGSGLPRLSVCIPARNEAGQIGPCVRAALDLDYPHLEVVVVDDGSEDGTGDEARAAGEGDERLRVISGTPPPSGWAGKPWACQRAAGEAAGELLLFVDADVTLSRWVARASVLRMEQERLDLLSLFGDWDLRSFWENAVVPVVGWFIRGTVDLEAVNSQTSPVAFANGQFILVRRTSYESIGGHSAVKSEVLEDVRLAKIYKQRAMSCGLFHAPGGFSVRLYESLKEIIEGYSKNLYEGMGRRPSVGWAAVGFIFMGTLLPYLVLAVVLGTRIALDWRLVEGGWLAWLVLVCILVPLFRWRLDRTDGRSGWHALSHPLGNLVLVWILLRSMFVVEARWKGRFFSDGRSV